MQLGFSKSIIKGYSYQGGFLKIDGMPQIIQLTFTSEGEIKTQDGFLLFRSSVNEASEEERKRRMLDVLQGNEGLASVFLNMMHNGKPKSLIERKNGKIILHNVNKSAGSKEINAVSSSAIDLFQFTTSSELKEHLGEENVRKQKAYGYENKI